MVIEELMSSTWIGGSCGLLLIDTELRWYQTYRCCVDSTFDFDLAVLGVGSTSASQRVCRPNGERIERSWMTAEHTTLLPKLHCSLVTRRRKMDVLAW